ncbi:hypothetical protein UPYG_G00333570 [Umbra pygmaea]|uniref:UPAR/Ly6 domain-containing protein n=1 Tax=Umbra pygmaea TaxID=75934 RepID=A0ABD0VWT6_UMBPY
MKTTLVYLLLIFFGNISVEALKCYSCPSAFSNTQCNQNTTTCSPEENNCLTAIMSFVGVNVPVIAKVCATTTTCSEFTSTVLALPEVQSVRSRCCQTDLCNVSGSTAFGINLLLLALSAILSGRFSVL